MSTIRKVADTAGVSIATVSRVINNTTVVTEEVREKVLAAINKCGYVPNVTKRNTSFLGLVYAGQYSLGSSYDMALVEGIGQAMDTTNFDLVLLNPSQDRHADETYTQYFIRKGVRGVILRSTSNGRTICEDIAGEDFPAVVVGDRFEHPSLKFVYSDSFASSKRAIHHLVSLGHQRIAFAANEAEDADHLDRYRAYVESMNELGLEQSPDLVFHVPAHRPDGAQLLRTMMSSFAPPSAVYITDPSVAVGLLNEAHSMQVEVPRDLSVVGFDDRDTRNYVYPKMTAVCQDAKQLGFDAYKLLSRIVEAGKKTDLKIDPASTWLELNQTTAPPSNGNVRVLFDGTRLKSVESEDAIDA